MKKYWIKKVLFLTILLCSCRIDHGLEPISSKITGSVHFTGELPRYTDQVRVAAVSSFPPKSINELQFSDALTFFQGNTITKNPVEWELYLPPGRYEVVAVVWKEVKHPWNLSDIIGLYGGSFVGDLLIPTYLPVTIDGPNSVVENIDIEANLNRVNRDTLIQGTITFLGKWPENTGVVGIGAFSEIPQKNNISDYFFKNLALDYSVPIFVKSYDYRLRVRSKDVLKYIAVLWIDNNFDLSTITDIGFYADPSDPLTPKTVTVSEDELINIDITVDFSEL